MTHVRVAVIGTGFSGIATALALSRAGRDDYVLLERNSEVGGTWWVNTYPGCQCDIPSQVYSLARHLNPDWSWTYARQEEIRDYLVRLVDDHDLRRHVVLGADVTDARWDGTRWEIETTAGSWTADVLVVGTGGLSTPSYPDVPGLSSYGGTLMHSAEWDSSWSSHGQRVGVIGTGSSAIQLVPEVQPDAAHLTLFQRTAPWVLPRKDKPVPAWTRALYRRVPPAQRLARTWTYWRMELQYLGFRYPAVMRKLGQPEAVKHLRAQVPDPELREKLTPRFTMGCKRVLLSNTWYPAITADNATVVTDRIVRVVPEGVVTEAADGTTTTHELDALLLGTGFTVQDPPIAHRVAVEGVTLHEHWKKQSMSALHGLAVAGVPNMFFLAGPNTGLGHNSVLLMIEAQADHVVKALDHLDRVGGRRIEAREDVQQAEAERVQRVLRPTVWNSGGCASWYLDEHGRNTTMWPGWTFTYMRQLRDFRPEEYLIS